ncbi:hypothetical protein [Paenibacillus sp. SI8]|uniref:hypothetical protein n=1 Tax=unclassified Paenibacillus TaxID=185978 RepID=UPI003467592A
MESATQRCPKCRRTFRVLADEVGDHDCPYGCNVFVWDKAEVERSLRGWLWRRVATATCTQSIGFYVRRFESMWTDEFGTDTPIPQDLKDDVNSRIKTLKEARI